MSVDWKVKGKFLKFGIKTYVIPGEDKEMKYEIVERINKDEGNSMKQDGVNILPIVISKSKRDKYILVIKNYRPPIDRYCIELPGGLIDENETIENAALRELKEETGYSGVVLSQFASPLLPVCPGTGSENTSIVPVLIDYDYYQEHPQLIKQSLDEDEVVDPMLIPLQSFSNTIKQLHQEGYAIEAQVYYYALSFVLSEKIGNSFSYFCLFKHLLKMNTIDSSLQKQLPTNVLLLITSSLCVLLSCIQIIFKHMDIIFFVAVFSLFISLETFFAAYNYRWKSVRILIPVHLIILLCYLFIGLFLILWREEYCSVIVQNVDECVAISVVYGFTNLCSGVIFHGLSSVVAYYFYRLFPTNESGEFSILNSHLFDEKDLLHRVEEYDNMKKLSDIHPSGNHGVY